jgi:predicted nucleic acid-binding protein
VGLRRFLLDTGIAGDFIDRRRGVFEHARHEVTRGNRVGIGMPVLAELAFGIELSTSRDRNMQSLRTALPAWKIWPFDDKAAFEYGRLADRAAHAADRHHGRRHCVVARQLHGRHGRLRSGRHTGAEGRES